MTPTHDLGAVSAPVRSKSRKLAFAWPGPDPALLVLIESDGTVVQRYESPTGSFRTIEHDGRVWRHQGLDQQTGERVYLPEVAPLT